jgi:prophage regulatory protein
MRTTTDDVTLLRPAAVLERRGCKKTEFYRDIQRGLMPPGIVKGRRFVVWPAYEVEAVNRAEIAGASLEERQALVRRLVKQRRAMKPVMAAEEAA